MSTVTFIHYHYTSFLHSTYRVHTGCVEAEAAPIQGKMYALSINTMRRAHRDRVCEQYTMHGRLNMDK